MILDQNNVADYADTLVLQVRAGGRELDYSEGSVATVEELLRLSDELFGLPTFPEAQRNLVVFYNGCYLGEVMRRQLGGTWRFDPGGNWFDASLVFPLGEGRLQVFPFQKAYRRIAEGPEENDLVAYYDGLKRKLAEPDRGRRPEED